MVTFSWKEGTKYRGIHRWINRNFERPINCKNCGKESKLEIHNISRNYTRDSNDWIWLCRDCHMEFDKRKEESRNRMINLNNKTIILRDSKGKFLKQIKKEGYIYKT